MFFVENVDGSIYILAVPFLDLRSPFRSCPVLSLPYCSFLDLVITVKWSSINSCLNYSTSSFVLFGAISIISFEPFDDGPLSVNPFRLAALFDVKVVELLIFYSSF